MGIATKSQKGPAVIETVLGAEVDGHTLAPCVSADHPQCAKAASIMESFTLWNMFCKKEENEFINAGEKRNLSIHTRHTQPLLVV